MKIERSTVEKLKISDVPRLDPITVIIEDFEPGKGKLIVECYGESWSAYWGAMGSGSTVSQFMKKVSADYVANCLWRGTGGSQHQTDWDGMPNRVRAEICKLRRRRELDRTQASYFFQMADTCVSYDSADPETMVLIFSDDWRICLPEVPNPRWSYLLRVVDTVQAAIIESHQEIPA